MRRAVENRVFFRFIREDGRNDAEISQGRETVLVGRDRVIALVVTLRAGKVAPVEDIQCRVTAMEAIVRDAQMVQSIAWMFLHIWSVDLRAFVLG